MDISQEILSDITVFNKYAKFLPEQHRRENWKELCDRNKGMHLKKYPQLRDEIEQVYSDFVEPKKVLPSMRSIQFGGRPIELANNRIFNCFSGDTRFITTKGICAFTDFDIDEQVYVPTHLGNIQSATVKQYGEQSLNEVTFSRGKSVKTVYVTSDHRWLLSNGSETTALAVGDNILFSPLADNFDYDEADPLERLYWCYGYIFGDGTRISSKTGEQKYSMVRLCGEDKNKYSYRFNELGFKSSEPHSCGGDTIFYTGQYLKTPPSSNEDLNLKHAFLDGYLCADAEKNPNWYKNTKTSKYISIQSSEQDHIEFLRNNLELFGYYIVSEHDISHEITNYGKRKEGTIKFRILNGVGETPGSRWSVKSIRENVKSEVVYCLEVENDRSFILSGGLTTGNCAYMPIDDIAAFWEAMFLLLGGSGVGYSVQKRHVSKLPHVVGPTNKPRRFLIGDSIEGWADSIRILIRAYFEGRSDPVFDFRDIRHKGARLVTSGGKAPGPDPLRICIDHIRAVLNNAVGRKLQTIEAHDIMCHIADSVLSGGIRRAALIALFSKDDLDMLSSKSGDWRERNPQRGRANNSVVFKRGEVSYDEFIDVWTRIRESYSGEPGIFWTNDYDLGTNPCAEISLKPCCFCNLTEINVSDVETQQELNDRSKAAAFLGTLQAGYTDFHYLRPIWKENTEKDALLGVSQTGIGSGKVLKLNLEEATKVVNAENMRIAATIGINQAARTTTVKPAGTTSLTLGTASGVHAWHNDYYIRRMRIGKNESLYRYMLENFPELVEDCKYKPHLEAVMSFPQHAPEGSLFRDEPALGLLERVKKFNQEWIVPGHHHGLNNHNVSCTISLKDDEWKIVGDWMWVNKDFYTGIAVLPYDNGSYVQAPFEDCSKETFEELSKHLHAINLDDVKEFDDNTNLVDQAACAGGVCEII